MYLALAATSVSGLLSHSGWIAKCVLLVLLLFSLVSWSIIIDRIINLRRLRARSKEFYETLRRSQRVADMLASAKTAKDSPLREMFMETYRELHDQVKDQLAPGAVAAGGPEARPQLRHTENIERTLQRVMRDQAIMLESGMAFLATTAASTPFIGLFGTVWGIMEAFQAIGLSGSATLSSVAPGISEALITTAAGLFAAIPALIGYNLLGRRLKAFNAYMEQFALDLINFLTNRFA
ncbi:MAG: MotA/TolQ/ExbB proton channel family protein [Acidobacteriota bacterium]